MPEYDVVVARRDVVYASSVGPRRFAPTVTCSPGSAASLPTGAIFPQLRSRFDWFMGDQPMRHPHHEDAYALQVWAPRGADGLPVLVFLHGGAWMTGGGALNWYDGAALARQGMVVVTINYRIGPLAHLVDPDRLRCDGPRDVVFDDILAALEWVATNVGEHGGDPDRVTLAGQSAGAWYAHALSLMPEAAGYFRRIALLSLPGREPWTPQHLEDVSERCVRLLRDDGWAGDLSDAPIGALLGAGAAAVRREAAFGPPAAPYLPVEEPRTPASLFDPTLAAQRLHVEAAYLRCTADEAAVFLGEPERRATQDQVQDWLASVPPEELPANLARDGRPFDTLVAAASWRTYSGPTSHLADAYSARGIPTLLRRFTVSSKQPGVRSGHCFDLPFQFADRAGWADAPMLQGLDDAAFGRASDELVKDLSRFITECNLTTDQRAHVAGAAPVDLG